MKKLIFSVMILSSLSIISTDAYARSACNAKKAVMNQRCKNAAKKPSKTNQRACANATNSYNKCLARAK